MKENLKRLRTFLESAPDGGKLLVAKDDLQMLIGVAEAVESGQLQPAMEMFERVLARWKENNRRQVETINRLLAER